MVGLKSERELDSFAHCIETLVLEDQVSIQGHDSSSFSNWKSLLAGGGSAGDSHVSGMR